MSIRRITLFKIPGVEDQQTLMEIYQAMPKNALKVCNYLSGPNQNPHTEIPQDDKPYIASVSVGTAQADQ
jgi:hypothetical protein